MAVMVDAKRSNVYAAFYEQKKGVLCKISKDAIMPYDEQ